MRRLQPAFAPSLESTAPTRPTLSMTHQPMCQVTATLLLAVMFKCDVIWASQRGGPRTAVQRCSVFQKVMIAIAGNI